MSLSCAVAVTVEAVQNAKSGRFLGKPIGLVVYRISMGYENMRFRAESCNYGQSVGSRESSSCCI